MKINLKYLQKGLYCLLLVMIISLSATWQDHRIVRLAKIQVDPVQLEQYNAALKEQMMAAMKVEPGVLTYYAVADKADPSHITILEIYADSAAYQAHTQTPHFKKYKATVQNMVKKLELEDVKLIGMAKKDGM
jgi:quinol monooxygenase YgiN